MYESAGDWYGVGDSMLAHPTSCPITVHILPLKDHHHHRWEHLEVANTLACSDVGKTRLV